MVVANNNQNANFGSNKVSQMGDDALLEPLLRANLDQESTVDPPTDPLMTDNLRVLFRQERSKDYETSDYLEVATNTRKRKRKDYRRWEMDACNRWEIGEWCYGVIDEFSFPREFAEITMSYVDRYLSNCGNDPPSSKQDVELLALTCFYLAVKLHQAGPVLSARQMAVMSGGTYGINEISTMEKKILFVLKWRLHPPCPNDFLRPFFAILSTHEILSPCEPWEDQVLVLARRMVESATLDYCIVLRKTLPSHLAAAVLINAVGLVEPEPWVPEAQEIVNVLNEHSDAPMDMLEIEWCLERIRRICPTSPPVPVVSPGTSFDEDSLCNEQDEWQPEASPNSVTNLRTFPDVPPFSCFY